MDWQWTAIIVSTIAAAAFITKTIIWAGVAHAQMGVNDEHTLQHCEDIDHLWRAVEILGHDVDRITPPEVSLSIN